MRSIADCEFDPGPKRKFRREESIEIPHTFLGLDRSHILNELENQLSMLSHAVVGFAHTKQQVSVLGVTEAYPRSSQIAITGQDIASHPSNRGSGSRIVIVTTAVLIGIGLGLFGASNVFDLAGKRDRLSGREAVDTVVGQIIRIESNGEPNAKNKNSTAAGIGQFIDETWLEMIRLYRPDLARAHTRDETLQFRRDATIAREITMRLAERNASLLKLRGFPVTAGTVYLAHFAGGAGSIAILSSPDNADAALVMANADATGRSTREQIVKANPFLDGFTVADLKRWADRKMRAASLKTPDLVAAQSANKLPRKSK
jgi:hypothetical protein